MTANAREKREVRQRMADTGENYTTALRKVREARAAQQDKDGQQQEETT
jgi:hypothetical protein